MCFSHFTDESIIEAELFENSIFYCSEAAAWKLEEKCVASLSNGYFLSAVMSLYLIVHTLLSFKPPPGSPKHPDIYPRL